MRAPPATEATESMHVWTSTNVKSRPISAIGQPHRSTVSAHAPRAPTRMAATRARASRRTLLATGSRVRQHHRRHLHHCLQCHPYHRSQRRWSHSHRRHRVHQSLPRLCHHLPHPRHLSHHYHRPRRRRRPRPPTSTTTAVGGLAHSRRCLHAPTCRRRIRKYL